MPAVMYKNAKGTRIPSVTTIIGNCGWGREGLMYWAWNLGMQNIDYRKERYAAADIGTLAHLACEADINGEPFSIDTLSVTDDERVKIQSCFDAWKRWRELSRLEMLCSEKSLISDKHQFGGTLDAAAIYGKRAIIDLKTGNAIRETMLLQISAYGRLWEENHPDEPIEEYHLIRIAKEDASFHHHMWPAAALEDAWSAFQAALILHTLAKKIRKQV